MVLILNSVEIFEAKRADNGDIDAVFRLLKIHTEKRDWYKCGEYALKIIDRKPGYCERNLLKHTGEAIRYEDVLGIIAIYYDERCDYEMTCRWVQKYSDYIDFAYRDLTWLDREQKKGTFELYRTMLENGELNKTEHRFMLKWEEKLYLKMLQNEAAREVKLPQKIAKPAPKGNSFLIAVSSFIHRMKKTLAL